MPTDSESNTTQYESSLASLLRMSVWSVARTWPVLDRVLPVLRPSCRESHESAESKWDCAAILLWDSLGVNATRPTRISTSENCVIFYPVMILDIVSWAVIAVLCSLEEATYLS